MFRNALKSFIWPAFFHYWNLRVPRLMRLFLSPINSIVFPFNQSAPLVSSSIFNPKRVSLLTTVYFQLISKEIYSLFPPQSLFTNHHVSVLNYGKFSNSRHPKCFPLFQPITIKIPFWHNDLSLFLANFNFVKFQFKCIR